MVANTSALVADPSKTASKAKVCAREPSAGCSRVTSAPRVRTHVASVDSAGGRGLTRHTTRVLRSSGMRAAVVASPRARREVGEVSQRAGSSSEDFDPRRPRSNDATTRQPAAHDPARWRPRRSRSPSLSRSRRARRRVASRARARAWSPRPTRTPRAAAKPPAREAESRPSSSLPRTTSWTRSSRARSTPPWTPTRDLARARARTARTTPTSSTPSRTARPSSPARRRRICSGPSRARRASRTCPATPRDASSTPSSTARDPSPRSTSSTSTRASPSRGCDPPRARHPRRPRADVARARHKAPNGAPTRNPPNPHARAPTTKPTSTPTSTTKPRPRPNAPPPRVRTWTRGPARLLARGGTCPTTTPFATSRGWRTRSRRSRPLSIKPAPTTERSPREPSRISPPGSAATSGRARKPRRRYSPCWRGRSARCPPRSRPNAEAGAAAETPPSEAETPPS